MRKEYSIYRDVELYRKGSIDMAAEKVPEHTAFAAKEGEYRVFSEDKRVDNILTTLRALERGDISELDIQIVCLVAYHKYMTTRQITEYLTLMGYNTKSEKVLSSVRKLWKYQILLISNFTDGVQKAGYLVISLDKSGSQIAQQRRVPHVPFSPFERVEEPWRIKKDLAAVQIQLAWLKSGIPLSEIVTKETVKGQVEDGSIVRPHLTVQLASGDVLMYEVVRSQPFWEKILSDKLQRYEKTLGNLKETDYFRETEPVLVLCAEDEEHAAKVKELIQKLGISQEYIFYTNDLNLFGKRFYQSLYHFEEDGSHQHFEFAC